MFRNISLALVLGTGSALSSVAQSVSNPTASPEQTPAPSLAQQPVQTAPSPHNDPSHKPPLVVTPGQQTDRSALPPNPLGDALTSYRTGDFTAAITKFQAVLSDDPGSPEAYAGLTRAYLKQRNVDQAWATVSKGLAANDSPRIRVALGEVYFRQGKIHEAEREWVQVINSGHPEPSAFLGLYRVRNAIAMYKQGKAMIDKAHELNPADPEITREWIDTLRRPDRIKYLEDYLAGPNNDDSEEREGTRTYIDYLKAREQEPGKKCHLVGKMNATETTLVPLLMDPQHLRG